MSTIKNYTGWQSIETIQAKEIWNELREAKEDQLAKLLIADTGLGKSNTIKLFQQKFPQQTFVVTVGDSFKLVDVVEEILHQVGADTPNTYTWRYNVTLRIKLKMIEDHMGDVKKKGGNPIIIIDEAENLKPNSLRMMKELYDHIIDVCSIVLIGTKQIIETIHNTRKRNRTGVPQLWRRFKAGTREISPINKARDFKQFFQVFVPEEKGIQDLLLELCDNYGEIHDYLHPFLQHAAKRSKPATEELFRYIHRIPAKKLKAV
jgi:DNA transposition AAA+ family ATPase